MDLMAENADRKAVEEMTTDEKLSEILILMRGVQDAIQEVSKNPMGFMSGMMG